MSNLSSPGVERSPSLNPSSHLTFRRVESTSVSFKHTSSPTKSQKSKQEKKIEEMEKKVSGFKAVENVLGEKTSSFLLNIFGLNKKNTFEEKIRRIIMLLFIFFATLISFVYILYCAYLFFIKNEALVSLANNTVCFVLDIIVLACMLIFPKIDHIFFGCGLVIAMEQITIASIQGLTGIRTGSEFNFISVALFAAVFGYEKTSTKIMWMVIFSANILAVILSDIVIYDIQMEIFMKEVSKTGAFDFILDNLFTYFAVFAPTYIFVLAYLINEVYKTFLSKIVVQQKKKIEKVEIIEDDLDLLIEEKKAEQDESVAHLKINKSLFEVPMGDVKLKKVLGQGGGGATVYLALWKGKQVAFKSFKTSTICENQNNFTEFEKELSILASVSHPNILAFYGASLKPPRIGILMEYCRYKNIRFFLHNYKKKNHERFPLSSKLKWFVEISSSIDFLHSKKIIHRDIKCENVLITESYETRLMDFGLSKSVENMDDKKTTRVGTSIYMAPEVYNSGEYSEKCDVFSFAIMIFEIVTENFDPYNIKKTNKKDMLIEFKVSQDGNFRPLVQNSKFYFCTWLIDLMKLCWSHHPNDRPSFNEINKIILENLDDEKNDGKDGVSYNSPSKLLELKKAQSNFNVIKKKVSERSLLKKIEVLEKLLKENGIELPKDEGEGESEKKEEIIVEEEKKEEEEEKEEKEEEKEEEIVEEDEKKEEEEEKEEEEGGEKDKEDKEEELIDGEEEKEGDDDEEGKEE